MHFTQVQLTGTMKAPGFFASIATSNTYFNIKDQKFHPTSVALLILTLILV